MSSEPFFLIKLNLDEKIFSLYLIESSLFHNFLTNIIEIKIGKIIVVIIL